MAEQPLVSVVTPSFNQAVYLESCMRSVLAQDYPNLEYFVVDGGSTDGSVDLIRRLADEHPGRLRWWVSEPDRGQADAISKGLRRARGESVAWLNSDDIYLQGALAKAVRAFQADKELGLLYSDVLSINELDEIINIMRFGKWGLADLMAFRIIGQPGVFMRRTALEEAGHLDTSYHMLLDHHLWLRIAQRQRMTHLDDCLAAARFHPAAKNLAQAEQFSREAFRLLEWMADSPELKTIYREREKEIKAGAYSFSARYLMDAGLEKQAVRDYIASLRSHPPTALRSLHRFCYALASLILPLEGFKRQFLAAKKARAVYNGGSMMRKWWQDGE